MSTTSNSSERYWALKSTNLKRINKDGSKLKHTKSLLKDMSSNRSTLTDIRKSSYPVLPEVPIYNNKHSSQSNYSKDSINIPDIDSASTSDYGSDISIQPSPHFNQDKSPKIIDNKSYHGFHKNKYSNLTHANKSEEQRRNVEINKKKFVLRTIEKNISLTKNRNGMNLQIFHTIQSICLEIVDEVLEDEIVLDVMIDAFKEIQTEVEQFNIMIMPVVRLTGEQILSECIDQLIHETTLMTLMKDSKSHLRAQIVSRWTLDDIVQSLLADICYSAIKEIVNVKLTLTRSDYIFSKLVNEFVAEDIITAGDLLFKEAILELILEEDVIFPVIEDCLRDISGKMIEYYHHKINRINLQQISLLATEAPLVSLVISHLVSVAARQKTVYGPSFVAQYCFENFVLEILLNKAEDIYDKLANTIDTQAVCHFHQEANQSIVSDSLLTELLEYSDADLCDLDAEEVQESYIPRFLGDLDKTFYSNNGNI